MALAERFELRTLAYGYKVSVLDADDWTGSFFCCCPCRFTSSRTEASGVDPGFGDKKLNLRTGEACCPVADCNGLGLDPV